MESYRININTLKIYRVSYNASSKSIDYHCKNLLKINGYGVYFTHSRVPSHYVVGIPEFPKEFGALIWESVV